MTAATLFFIGCGTGAGANGPSAELAGAKAALLSRVAALGLRVPPAFVLPTSSCQAVNRNDAGVVRGLESVLQEGIRQLELATGRRFGDCRRPLLVSVRSGAARSMPGMLDTVLNVGLNAETVRGLIRMFGNPRLAWDCYRRFIQGYAEVVAGAQRAPFEEALGALLATEGAASEAELDSEALERLALTFQRITGASHAVQVPDDPAQQLLAAVRAVYASWDSPRATEYRRLNDLGGLAGTAVTIQAMVFGNAGGRSGAGVAFTRNPSTGQRDLYVDFLFDAQGEDVVSGRRTPRDAAQLAERLPDIAHELARGAETLERAFKDVQDVEFTVEENVLYFLQTRAAKRTARAALRAAVDMVREGLIDEAEGLARIADVDPDAAAVKRFTGSAPPIGVAIPAAAGVISGRVAFDSGRAKLLRGAGDPIILVRREPSTDDVEGFAVASGILTATGGRTSHAAVVARQLGKVCIVGCGALAIDADDRRARLGTQQLTEGDWISLDGDSGEIFPGRREIVVDAAPVELAEIARWREGQVHKVARNAAAAD